MIDIIEDLKDALMFFTFVMFLLFILGGWVFFGTIIITAIIIALVVWCHRVAAKRRRQLADRADQQHKWVLEDDPRGIYGDWCHMLKVDGSWYGRDEAVKRLSGEWKSGWLYNQYDWRPDPQNPGELIGNLANREEVDEDEDEIERWQAAGL